MEETLEAARGVIAGEIARRDRDEELAGARRAAGVVGEGRRVDREVGAGKPRGEDLDEEGHPRPLVAASRHHGAALQRTGRVGGGLAVGIERPAERDGLAALLVDDDLALGDDAGRLVEDERLPPGARHGKRDRIGAEDRFRAAHRGDRGGCVDETEGQEALAGDPLDVITDHPAIVGVGDGEGSDALGASCFAQRRKAEVDGRMGKARLRIDPHQARLRAVEHRPGLAVDLADPRVLAIGRQPGKAMAVDPLSFGRDHRCRDGRLIARVDAAIQQHLPGEGLDLPECQRNSVRNLAHGLTSRLATCP